MSTRIDEIADGIYRISTAMRAPDLPGGFTFNQYLIDDDDPLLFHTGMRRLYPAVSAAVATVVPIEKLRHIGFSHVEADECGALNQFLAAAPRSAPLCSRIGAMTSIDDMADRPPQPLADGAEITLGRHTVRWLDAPHVPHGWDCGFLFETSTKTLLCGDLFTQGGADHEPVTEGDILGPALAAHQAFDYYSQSKSARPVFDKLIATSPDLLACMHGSAWRGDGGALLGALADEIA